MEGVRHREAVDTLREQLHERRVLLVYVEVPDSQRSERLVQRAESAQTLTHEVESDVESLRAIADLIVETDQPAKDLVAAVSDYVEGQRDAGGQP